MLKISSNGPLKEARSPSDRVHRRHLGHAGHLGHLGWTVLFRPEIRLAEATLVPDLAGWRGRPRRSRLAPLCFGRPPDWVCEAKAHGRDDAAAARFAMYAQAGVRHAWRVDRAKGTVEVYVNDGREWFLAGAYRGAAIERARPFAGEGIALASFWDAVASAAALVPAASSRDEHRASLTLRR